MSMDIVMPKLSDTMEEGKILRWLKHAGDAITAGEVIAEVETDKADMELEAAESGVLTAIQVPAGESAAVGAVIAVLDGAGVGAAPSQGDAARPKSGGATVKPEAAGGAPRPAADGEDATPEDARADHGAPPPTKAAPASRAEHGGRAAGAA